MITKEIILHLHELSIIEFGGSHGLRDEGLIESAVARPYQTFGGEDLYQTVYEKAAALVQSIIINHPFVDGNKRTALATCLVFLDENGIVKVEELNVERWEDLTLKVADGQLGREEIVERLRELLELR